MARPNDIYTRLPISEMSREHVLPNFLGGALEAPNLIDKSTNDRFGATIDAALDRATLPFRNILDARSHRDPSRPVPTLHNVSGTDGKKYHVDAGGRIRLIPEVRVEKEADHVNVAAVFSEMGDIRKALRKTAQRAGKDLDLLMQQLTTSATFTKQPNPELMLSTDLYSTDCYRAIAKIACNHFCLRGLESFFGDAFDGIRTLVLNGAGNATAFVQPIGVDISSSAIGPLDHLATSWLDENGRAGAFIVLFGFLGFAIDIGTLAKKSRPFLHTYRVDQLGRCHRQNASADISIDLPSFESAYTRTHEEFQAATLEQVQRLARSTIRIRDARSLEGLVDRRWKDFFGEDSDCDPEDPRLMAFGNALAAEFSELLLPQFQRAAERRRLAVESLLHDKKRDEVGD